MVKHDILEALHAIDPAQLDYQGWVNVGMALKDEGFSVDVWDEWSKSDINRYHANECARKWQGFSGSVQPVTAGTIVQYARDQGWSPPFDEGHALDWDSTIGNDYVVVDRNWIEAHDVPEPDDWHPAAQLIRYLELLFEAAETVGYVTESWQKDDRYLPAKGSYSRTAGELIEQLNQCRDDDIGAVLGDYKPEAGAWIRFNPLDGKGVKNDNVTEFRYALVESDSMPIEKQYAIIHELELPVAVLVHSGGKSLHAIVKIDAASYDEYRKRVDYLYKVCEKNGLKIDTQNRNPSRLSRMPGVIRNGNRQYIVAENIGLSSYEQWQEWIEGINDDLPDAESLADVWDNLPALSPSLIAGVLRQGHKMLLAGPSKAGKSFSLIALCVAIAEGNTWMGWQCAKGRVLYVNLELDRASCLHRFRDVYSALKIPANSNANIDIWNLRGKAVPMDKLAPKLIRRAAKKGYIAIVIDPIYKIITGDENSADQMANFCNQFDRVCTELGCAVIYCHHHSKGMQGQKRSMDRASGSGVFARDPDAMLDMIELPVSEELAKAEGDRAALEECKAWLARCAKGWEEQLSQDDLCSLTQTLFACQRLLSKAIYQALLDAVERVRTAAANRSAWRLEGTLREFRAFPPVNVWFEYPVHVLDAVGCLQDADADTEEPPWKRATSKRKANAKDAQNEKNEALERAIEACNMGDPPTKKDLAEYLGIAPRTVNDRLKAHGGYVIDQNNGNIIVRRQP